MIGEAVSYPTSGGLVRSCTKLDSSVDRSHTNFKTLKHEIRLDWFGSRNEVRLWHSE
jgi:hypothetical protein